MSPTLFFADILGFSALAEAPGAQPAVDALTAVASLLSNRHEIARFLQTGSPWTARYGLSDALFLVAEQPETAARAAAEFFFNLAFCAYQASDPILIRGAITDGEVRHVPGLFPETSSKNVVGEAVVQAVLLEKSGPKGPRLLLSEAVARVLEQSELAWMVDREPPDPYEFLWLLPPDPALMDSPMIGDVANSVVRFFLDHTNSARTHPHYVAYLDVVVRSLLRLKKRDPKAGAVAIARANLQRVRAVPTSLLGQILAERLEQFLA